MAGVFYFRLVRIVLFILSVLILACSEKGNPPISFEEQIAPVIFENCSPCHHSQGPAPFNLTNLTEVKKKAKTIQEVINSGYMPPWPADTTYTSYIGEKVLNAREIELLNNWIDDGTYSNGETSEYIPIEQMNQEPDLVVKLPKIELKGDNTDQFYLMKVPIELNEERFVKLAVLKPGNSRLVHHCDAHLITYVDNKKSSLSSGKSFINVDEEETYQAAYAAMNIFNDDGSYPTLTPGFMHYLPGSTWNRYPDEIGGFKLNKKSVVLINQMHYGPSPKADHDQSELHLYFTDEPPKRHVKEIVLGSGGMGTMTPELIIPPGQKKTFKITYTLNKKISVLTVNPHMHLLGEFIEAQAILPSNEIIPLSRVNQWDFRWQNFYTFKRPVVLDSGTEIIVTGRFDNTSDNPFNPNDPPQMVDGLEGSMKSTDEMFQFSLNYMDYREGDENIDLDITNKP